MMEQRLFGVEPPALAEAPSSWLARAAAGQGASVREFVEFLGFSHHGDYDIQFADMVPIAIASICGLRPNIFDGVHRMLKVGLSLRMEAPVFLSQRNRARYRYCPECLKGWRTPHFPIHWRIDAYRMCHIHRCMLEDECPHCAAMIFPHADWMYSGPRRQGISMASQCLRCCEFLWKVSPLKIDELPPFFVSELDMARLENGRAFVAALVHERVAVPRSRITDIQIGSKFIEKTRLLATGTELDALNLRSLYFIRSSIVPCEGMQTADDV